MPRRGAGRCGHLIKDQPGQGAWPRWKGASLVRRSLSGQMGRHAPQRDLVEIEEGSAEPFVCAELPHLQTIYLPWPKQ